MIPFGTNDVTVFHANDDGTIERRYLKNASWTMHTHRTQYDGLQKMASSNSCSCRWARGTVKAVQGDLLVLGRVSDNVRSAVQFADLMEKYAGRAFICESFSDNTAGSAPLKHYCAKGAAYGA